MPGVGLGTLDYDYVCSSSLSGNSQEARIDGLENGKRYQFLLVAYDRAGNPAPSETILVAAPVETRDAWEQCGARGDICGEAGYCSVQSADATSRRGLLALTLGLFGLAGLGVRRRRRRSA